MVDVFLKIVNMSISASWLVLAVLVFRLVFKKAPKWIHVLLWGIVAVRLLCPFSIESALSLIPSAETISPEIMMSREPTIHTGVPAINSVVNPIITETFAPEPVASANPLQILIPVLAMIWGIGVALLLAYTAISYWRLRRRVRMAVLLRDNIYQSEAVSSPFVLGIIKPKICLPFQIDGQNLEHVVSHEQAHIRRRDHWWKPLGFLLLTIHWFNLLMWLAYVLLCRDIELACDEKVVKELGKDQRADYSQALLACSVSRRMIAACPLAFGEVGVKERVKSVLNYKKPAFWVIVTSVIACAVVAVCFLTNPKVPSVYDIYSQDGYVLLGQERVNLTLSVPKDVLPDSIYTSDGHEFEKDKVVAYRTNNTTIYLHKAMLSNESEDLLYFYFDFSYDFSNYGDFLSPYSYVADEEDSTVSDLWLYSEDLKDAKTVYPDALSVRGHGPGTQFAFYVSKEAYQSAEGDMLFDIACNKVFYAKSGYEDEASQMMESTTIPDKITFRAEVLEIRNGYFLVKPEDSWAINSADQIEVPMKNMDPSLEPQVGDIIEISYSGEVLETYPARLSEVYSIKVAEETNRLSLNDVIILSQYGYDLSWSDFENYDYIETGSGLYIRVYEIDERFHLSIGGVPNKTPMYIYLGVNGDDVDARIDIRDGGVVEFISENASIQKLDVDALEDLLKAFKESLRDEGTVIATDCVLATDGAYGLDGVVQYTDESGVPWKLAFIRDGIAYPVGLAYTEEHFVASGLTYLGNGAVQVYIENSNSGKIEVCTMEYFYDEEENHTKFRATTEDYDTQEGNDQESEFDQYYLTIGADDVIRIEFSMSDSSGGFQNADGSLLKKGEKIWLENLDGYPDLRGLSITAFNRAGEIIWSASIPDGEDNRGFTHLTQDGWTITNIK